MSSTTTQVDEVLQGLATLRQQLGQLTARIEALEANSHAKSVAAAEPAAASRAASGAPDDLIAVISAAIAAYLGEKPRIRQIRLLGSASWSEQGRATIQASHAITPRHN